MRNLTTQMVDELSGPAVHPALLAQLQFDSATIFIWSGYGNLDFNGDTYLGGGQMIQLSAVEETQELEAKGLTCTLNGIPGDLVATSLERCRGRPFRLFLAMVGTTRSVATEDGTGVVRTEDGGRILLENQLVDTPYRLFTGMMDVMEMSDTGETSAIQLSVENSLITGQRAKVRRYTSEDQKKIYPNDKGFDLIPQLQDKEIVW